MERYKFSKFTIATGLSILLTIGIMIYLSEWLGVGMGFISLVLLRRIAVYDRLIHLHEESESRREKIIQALLKYTGQDN